MILNCSKYISFIGIVEEGGDKEEPRVLGLAMIPGHHIVSIEVDVNRTEPPAVI